MDQTDYKADCEYCKLAGSLNSENRLTLYQYSSHQTYHEREDFFFTSFFPCLE